MVPVILVVVVVVVVMKKNLSGSEQPLAPPTVVSRAALA